MSRFESVVKFSERTLLSRKDPWLLQDPHGLKQQ
jgi:hypothetical protein